MVLWLLLREMLAVFEADAPVEAVEDSEMLLLLLNEVLSLVEADAPEEREAGGDCEVVALAV
jgi:hypothetical protein